MSQELITPQTNGPSSIPMKQNIPNNQSSVVMGMPFKPMHMTQGGFFAMSRAAYNKGVNQNVKDVGKAQEQIDINNKPNGKKKWYGASGSRSASEHINLKGIESTGKGSTNRVQTQLMSFSGPDQTTTKTALARCRGGGCIAPKKKGAN